MSKWPGKRPLETELDQYLAALPITECYLKSIPDCKMLPAFPRVRSYRNFTIIINLYLANILQY